MKHALSILEPVSVEYLMREIRTAGLHISAGFPSPAGDDLEEPIDLVGWMVRHETATFWYRVSGSSLNLAGILDGEARSDEHLSFHTCCWKSSHWTDGPYPWQSFGQSSHHVEMPV